MKLYLNGTVVSHGKNYIIFENNNTGVILNVNNPAQFEKNKFSKVFIYEYKTEFLIQLYGFKYFRERILFEDLLSVSGVGPKTSLNILAFGYKKVLNALTSNDPKLLTSIKSVGNFTATQIIHELNRKYKGFLAKKTGLLNPTEVSSTLKTLGFNAKQINFALDKLEPSKNLEVLVEKAITIISNEYQSSTN